MERLVPVQRGRTLRDHLQSQARALARRNRTPALPRSARAPICHGQCPSESSPPGNQRAGGAPSRTEPNASRPRGVHLADRGRTALQVPLLHSTLPQLPRSGDKSPRAVTRTPGSELLREARPGSPRNCSRPSGRHDPRISKRVPPPERSRSDHATHTLVAAGAYLRSIPPCEAQSPARPDLAIGAHFSATAGNVGQNAG